MISVLCCKGGKPQSQQEDAIIVRFQSRLMRSFNHNYLHLSQCRCDDDCGKVELGERMALQVFAATEATEAGKDSQSVVCGWERELAEQDSRAGRAKELLSIASMAKSKLESKQDAARSGEPCGGDSEVRHA